ncbi:MAG: transposase [Microcoleus sp. PH2017_10_PVI_O_A]|uniref:IS110 family transposase n=1 Tax=unclassified Microcoleus TaxID=2642155 RepID=UPI001DD0253A|nr:MULTISPECIES: transposase [unclassified Microcoleus]TAE74224.1 MAG: IS110 family transposase [Oscillatoriales cyanobacterium]MCC3409781.1 transposase [Microcoleus sp. PH2017_10_PVI_O_A]MCC3464059.1 transposase [Microcoleus sp. PH2017_11_PCY_U_A]MCC3482380.1 transposase [Microcoleus sp. PH2017_12_PCY_D_A]MCC3532216.1 transposase [Microcoleus sp. PH2017_21_RUC_O_A]
MKIVGIDVSADRIDVVVLDKIPDFALRDFYKSAEFKSCHFVFKTDEIGKLIETIGSDCVVVLEATGTYSYFWKEQFSKQSIPVLVADQGMVKSTRKSLGGTDNKDDAFDALVMISLYQRHYVEIFDRRFWVADRPAEIKQIKRLLLDLKTTVQKQTAFINTTKSRLAFEYPAKAKISSKRPNGNLDPSAPPPFWAWLAGKTEAICSRWLTRFNTSYKLNPGSGISDLTRQFAAQICDLHAIEASLEIKLAKALECELFGKYHQVFDLFRFGLRERGWILSRIFPFDSFLHLPKKTALRRFRQACGLGKIEKSSGQVAAGKGGSRWTGCSNTRSILWTYVHNRIEPENISRSSVQSELREFYVQRKFNANGTKKRGRQLADARNATCRKLADSLFREIYRAFKT